MSNNVTDLDNKSGSEMPIQSYVPSEKSILFQLFFSGFDQSRSVEVVESNEIGFGEIIHRLKMGECVFINYKDPEKIEPRLKIKKGRKQSPWYFARCWFIRLKDALIRVTWLLERQWEVILLYINIFFRGCRILEWKKLPWDVCRCFENCEEENS